MFHTVTWCPKQLKTDTWRVLHKWPQGGTLSTVLQTVSGDCTPLTPVGFCLKALMNYEHIVLSNEYNVLIVIITHYSYHYQRKRD